MVGDNAAETAELVGDVATAKPLDVADEAAIEQLVQEVEQQQGGIDLFVSNAGYGRPGR